MNYFHTFKQYSFLKIVCEASFEQTTQINKCNRWDKHCIIIQMAAQHAQGQSLNTADTALTNSR